MYMVCSPNLVAHSALDVEPEHIAGGPFAVPRFDRSQQVLTIFWLSVNYGCTTHVDTWHPCSEVSLLYPPSIPLPFVPLVSSDF